LVGILRDNADNPFKPPGAGYEAPLRDLVVHSMDIYRPIGLELDIPMETLQVVLGSVTSARSLKFFNINVTGLEVCATDTDWTLGSGLSVVGDAADLVLTFCGRPAGLVGLTGEGVPLLIEQLKKSS
jgi:hypothetical protein